MIYPLARRTISCWQTYQVLLCLSIVLIEEATARLEYHDGKPFQNAKGLGARNRQRRRKISDEYDDPELMMMNMGKPIRDYDYYAFPVKDSISSLQSRALFKRDDSSDKDSTDDDEKPIGASEGAEGDRAFEDSGTFNDWNSDDNAKAWKRLTSKCDPATSEFLSPVDIPTKKAQLVKDANTALFVFSKFPKEKTYFVSTQYHEAQFRMEAFTIRRRNGEVLRDVTYISGLGSTAHRFFQSALIMFRNPANGSNLGPKRSMHKINGHEFDMEVVMVFSANGPSPEITQIHVLVNVTDVDNPAWTPIIDMLQPEVGDIDKLWEQIRHEGCTKRKKREKIEDDYVKAFSKFRKVKAKITKAVPANSDNAYDAIYRDMQDFYESVKDSDESIIARKSSQINSTRTELENCNSEVRNMANAKMGMQQTESKLSSEIKAAEAEISQGKSSYMAPKLKEKWTVDFVKKKAELKDLPEKIIDVAGLIDSKKHACDKLASRLAYLQEEVAQMKENLLANHIGTPESRYGKVADVKKQLDTLRSAIQEYRKVKETYDRVSLRLEKNKVKPQRNALIKAPFQISWLLPAIGGYYMYDGSSPVPPCNDRAYTIVMEKQITISKRQLQNFTEFPSILTSGLWTPDGPLCDTAKYDMKATGAQKEKMQQYVKGLDKMKDQVPVIHEFGDRPLTYVKKNLQFEMDDGLHMVSKVRWRLKHPKSR